MIEYNEEKALELVGLFEITEIPIEETETGFYHHNGWFGYVDAYVLQGIVRMFKPKLIIEAGCGWSSILIDETTDAEHWCIDPHPRRDISSLTHVIEKPVQEMDPTFFDRLDANDILFIDTSHVWTEGGELPYFFNVIFPRLKKDVIVHFHDIFLPWPYPPQWITDGYNEQYMVEKLLDESDMFEIIFPAHLMARHRPDELTAKFGLRPDQVYSGSMWLKKC